MGRAARRLALVAVALAALALAGLALAGGAAGAARTSTCNVKSLYQKPGYPQYVTSLTVAGVPCSTGVTLVRAYYACRVRAGGPFYGRCHHAVLGFSCREQRQGISIVYNATVTCRRGRATVVHRYTQNR
jgi:hypothetical protein